jgi:hypothetical protein
MEPAEGLVDLIVECFFIGFLHEIADSNKGSGYVFIKLTGETQKLRM